MKIFYQLQQSWAFALFSWFRARECEAKKRARRKNERENREIAGSKEKARICPFPSLFLPHRTASPLSELHGKSKGVLKIIFLFFHRFVIGTLYIRRQKGTDRGEKRHRRRDRREETEDKKQMGEKKGETE
jgi:hypothetical protein